MKNKKTVIGFGLIVGVGMSIAFGVTRGNDIVIGAAFGMMFGLLIVALITYGNKNKLAEDIQDENT